MNVRRLFLYTLIGSVAISAALGIFVILFGSFGEFEARILVTTFSITCTSILGLANGAYYETGRAKAFPLAGIAFSVLACFFAIYQTWVGDWGVEAIWKSGATAAILATVFAHLSLISLATLDRRFLWSRLLLYVADIALAAILLFILWFEPDSSSDIVGRIIGVLSIIIAALTIVTPVFHKLSDKGIDIASIDAEIEVLRRRIDELEAKKASVPPTEPSE